MDILFVLIPLSVVMTLAIIVVLVWAFSSEQFEQLDFEGERILDLHQDQQSKNS
jgi:cbb3-type cytochrome oxidase maturation protein